MLVTGASGFIGAAVCRRLAAEGAEVHGTGRTRPSPAVAEHHRVALPADAMSVMERVRPMGVIHLAAPVMAGANAEHRSILETGIVDGTISMAKATHRLGVPMVHAGTCAEYGSVPSPHREDGAVRPVDAYGELKLQATQQALAYPNVSVGRIFRAIGPGDTASVVAAAARAALTRTSFSMTSGEQIREWNHVDAVAAGLLHLLARPVLQGCIVNIGGGPELSVRAVVEMVFDAADCDRTLIHLGARPQRPGEVASLVGDHRRARAAWGEVHQPAIQDTVRDAVEWTRTHLEDAA